MSLKLKWAYALCRFAKTVRAKRRKVLTEAVVRQRTSEEVLSKSQSFKKRRRKTFSCKKGDEVILHQIISV